MFNRISSLILAVLLFVVLFSSSSSVWVVVASMAVLIVATFAINFKRIGLTWPHLLLPILFLLGVGSVFTLITNPDIRVWILLGSSIAFYWLEINLGHESHVLQNIYLASVFGIYVGIFGLNHYFQLSTLVATLLVFAATYVLIVQGFAGFSLPSKKYFHWLTTILVSETAWGLTLWPTHFVTNAVVAFSVFYLIWIFSFSAFFGKLSWKKIYLQTGLITIVLIITLWSAAWMPLVG